MRVLVNDIVAVPGSGGVFSVLTDFYDEVEKYNRTHDDVEWIFLLAGNYVKESSKIKVITLPEIKKSWIKRLEFELYNGKKLINSLNPDVYISLQNTMTLGVKAATKWTYLHQPLPYQKDIVFSIFKKNERKMWIYQHLVGTVINFTLRHGNSKVIVQTKWMKDAVIKKNIVSKDKVVILPPNNIKCDTSVSTSVPKQNEFFYPATGMPYKNHEILFKAVRELEQEGIRLNLTCTLNKNDLENLGLTAPKSVKLIGMVPRDKILKMYGKKVLIFPSLLETFGLPLLEARMANDYILAGKTRFCKEILDNYPNVAYFDPHDKYSIKQQIKKCVHDGIKLRPDDMVVQKPKSLISLVLS